jgi:hypothetical protein
MRLRVVMAAVLIVAGAYGVFGATPPRFSFVFGGRKSSEFLSSWKAEIRTKILDEHRTQETLVRSDPASGLQVRRVTIRYGDLPVTEWTIYVKNTGKRDTPIIEDLRAIDWTFSGNKLDDVVLHHNVGAPADGTDYDPIETPLPLNFTKRLSGAGGRPTNADLSYFNVSWGDRGEIIVVGWPGQWEATIGRQADGAVHVSAGQERTHFKLHPGEEVRTPLIVRLPWTGDWIRGQNLWRHWMMLYGMPRPYGKLPQQTMLGYSGRVTNEMVNANEANQIHFIDRYLEEGFKLDYWWMDAGWYIQQRGWPQVGTWEVDPKRFPNGLRAISDHAHQRGVKTLLWFEPERVASGTWLSTTHPEWLLGNLSPLVARRSSKSERGEPFVMFNSSDHPIDWHGIHWSGHRLSFHPGPHGEHSVVRFTAPTAGKYRIACAFAAIDPQATTDVHVLQGRRALFDAWINLKGHGNRTDYTGAVDLRRGETVDFVVGYGEGRFFNDTTGLDATITAPSGRQYDAAKQFGVAHGAWAYGFLPPGPIADTGVFVAYDLTEPGLEDGDRLLNLGDRRALNWLVNHTDRILVDQGIDLYRQDFNIDPLDDWRGNDPDDRQGITENKYIVGYLAYWDELRRRHPNMLIDSCASGGRRNDLETMRRAVPLWRSDLPFQPTAHQGMTYGIAMWLPFFGTGTVANGAAPYYGSGVMPVVPYDFWSTACPSLMSELDILQRGYDYDTLRRLWTEWRQIGPYFYGDYYPLTQFSRNTDVWLAWQFNRPDDGDGLVEAFRRPGAPDKDTNLKLRGLDPTSTYRFTVIDGPALKSAELTGDQLMSTGLLITLPVRPQCAVIKYQRR